ncbi:hypothetical protein WDW86_13955 [Bdellovibrionota bacterium FG-2]
MPVDSARFRPIPKKAHKHHWIHSPVRLAFDTDRVRTIEDFKRLPETKRGHSIESLVAQEIWRRAALTGDEAPKDIYHFQSGEHEADFITPGPFFATKFLKV